MTEQKRKPCGKNNHDFICDDTGGEWFSVAINKWRHVKIQVCVKCNHMVEVEKNDNGEWLPVEYKKSQTTITGDKTHDRR